MDVWASVLLSSTYMLGTFNHCGFKVNLGSFGAFAIFPKI